MQNRENVSDTLIGLVSRYSPSGHETEAVDWLVERMKTLGFNQAFRDEAGNAVGVVGNGARQIVLLGHIDTVPGVIPVRVEEGVLYGRGVVDAKSALACFVDSTAGCGAMEGWQIVVIGAVGEERDSQGAYYVVDRYMPEYAIIGEPNRWDRVALGYKGTAWAEITVRREQSHSAGGGQTAPETAVEIWQVVQSYAKNYNEGKTRLFTQIQTSLQSFESGKDDFEQWAKLRLSARLPFELSPEEWYAELEKIAMDAKVEPLGRPIPAWVCEKNTRLVRALLAGIRENGGVPAFVYKTGTADLNIVAPVWKCPTLVYGPGDSKLDHTPGEKIELAEYQKSVRVLGSALNQLTR